MSYWHMQFVPLFEGDWYEFYLYFGDDLNQTLAAQVGDQDPMDFGHNWMKEVVTELNKTERRSAQIWLEDRMSDEEYQQWLKNGQIK